VQAWIPFGRIGELLGLSIESLVSAFDQQHIEAILGRFERDHNAGWACADYS
jgi:hypothetical protein